MLSPLDISVKVQHHNLANKINELSAKLLLLNIFKIHLIIFKLNFLNILIPWL